MSTRAKLVRAARAARLEETAWRGIGATERLLGRSAGDIVYLVSLAGHPNYGDELVLRTWLRHLAKVRPAATVVVDVAHLSQASLLFAHEHPRAVFVDTLWRLAREADERPEVLGDRTPQDWVAAAATDLSVVPGLAEGVDHLLRAHSIHVLGGGYLNAIWPQWLPVVSAAAAVARKTGARAYATGLGLLPLPDGAARDRLLADAAAFTVFDVRDQASFDAIGSVPGRSLTVDDVWLGVDAAAAPAPPHDGEVMLCLQEDLADDFTWDGATGAAGLAAYVTAILDDWQVPAERITVVEGIPGIDYTVPKLMGERLRGTRIIPFLDVWRRGLPVGGGRTWISTRFHPHLVAGAAGDSGVAIVPKPDYYGIKHASLTAVGSRWTVVDGAALPPRPTAGGFSAEDVRANTARKAELAARLYS